MPGEDIGFFVNYLIAVLFDKQQQQKQTPAAAPLWYACALALH